MVKNKKIGLISLGCDKNRVDSEKILGLIGDRAIITNDIEEANIIIVNSCAFLESAREEAIDTVLECNELRSKNLEKIECYNLPEIMFYRFDKNKIKTRSKILSSSDFFLCFRISIF